jgi:hypothetical protein
MGRSPLVPEHLRSAYLGMRVDVQVEGEWLSAGEAVQRLSPPLTVITAINPWIDHLAEPLKAARLAALRTAFVDRGLVPRECRATSAAGAAFPGWAAEGLQQRAARKLGRQLEKGVVFHLTGDEIRLLGCSFRWRRERPIVGWVPPSGPSAKTLSAAMHATFAVTIEPSFKRAAMPGWIYEHRLELPCPVCGEQPLEVFGANLTSRSGAPCRATAFLCCTCGDARLPHAVPAEYRAYNDCLRNLATAKRDADQSGLTERSHWVYAIELKDSVGARQGDLPWVYVGETTKTPEKRFDEHCAGVRESGAVYHHGLKLRPDLYKDQPILRSEDEAKAYEKYLWTRLQAEGYSVKGGH